MLPVKERRTIKEIVHLSNSELSLVKFFSEQRFKNQRRSKITTQKVASKESDEYIDLIGAIGEYGVCKYLDIAMETDLSNNTDFGKDLVYNSHTIDIKTTYHKTGKLLFRSPGHFKSSVAVLTVVEKDNLHTVNICGIISKRRFMDEHTIMNLGYGNNLVVTQEQLSPISMLKVLDVG
jgi:hypothetical protein